MYHHFSDRPAADDHTIDRETCEWQMRVLRKEATVWPLRDYFAALESNSTLPRNLVVITVDDGYRDFYEIAYPILRSQDLPATLFPVVEFVEGRDWLWHDKLDWMLRNARPGDYQLAGADGMTLLALTSDRERSAAWERLCAWCISVGNDAKLHFLDDLAARLEIELPAKAPPERAPCSWAELEEMSRNGIEIGAHSMTHPILSKLSAEALRFEVGEPRRIFRQRINVAADTFCYPNGAPDDINEEVISAVRDSGYKGAVVTRRYPPSLARYATSRIGTARDRREFLWKVRGWEQAASGFGR